MNVVFDLDGTLADITHRLHHIEPPNKNWPAFFRACGDDAPIPAICGVYNALVTEKSKHGNTCNDIEIWSGRSSEVWDETVGWFENWLGFTGFVNEPTIVEDLSCMRAVFRHACGATVRFQMRLQGHYQNDGELKRAWMQEAKARSFPIDLAFDDRDRVVQAWRDEGVKCCQVAPGDF